MQNYCMASKGKSKSGSPSDEARLYKCRMNSRSRNLHILPFHNAYQLEPKDADIENYQSEALTFP